jgi:REP-associated tyrosine transposase
MERYRISDEAGLYFVTMTVVDWLPVFVSEATCRIIAENLNVCHERKGLRIHAYVIMPTHLHAILFIQKFDPLALKATLTDFRKFTGRKLIEHCRQWMPPCFDEVLLANAGDDRDRRFWQPTMHPEQIETEAFYRQKLDYLHDNPCRKGLVQRPEYWRYPSASHLLSEGTLANDVILSRIEW